MDILVTIFTAFISGVLATAMGALGSVILTALVSIVGVFSIMAGCEYNIIGNICFGMFLGPQVAFGPALRTARDCISIGLTSENRCISSWRYLRSGRMVHKYNPWHLPSGTL